MTRERKEPLKVTIIADGLPPFDIETQEYNIGNVVEREVHKRSKFWVEALYYIEHPQRGTLRGTRYNTKA